MEAFKNNLNSSLSQFYGNSQVHLRKSYGGGFSVPSKPQTKLPEYSFTKNYEETYNPDYVESLEARLQQLKAQSEQLKSQGQVSSSFYQNNTSNQNLTIEEIEILREQQSAKLLELQAEYNRTKNQTPSNTQVLENFNYRSFSPKQTHKSRFSPSRQKYEDKFQRYLENKRVSQKPKSAQRESKTSCVLKKTKGDFEKVTFLRWMFSKLDKDNSGTIDKVELMQEFHQNPDLAELFGLREHAEHPHYMERFEEVFSNIGLSGKFEFSFEDLVDFFGMQTQPEKQKVSREKKKPTSKGIIKEEQPVCLLTNKHMELLEDVFLFADKYQDLALKRSELVNAMRANEKVAKILNVDSVRISDYQVLNLETMLEFIEFDGEGPEEHITWNQFLDYFFSKPKTVNSEAGIEDPSLDEVDLPNYYLQIIENLFESLPFRSHNKVSTFDLISGMREDSQIKGFLSMTSRENYDFCSIGRESLGEVLNRMEKEADSLISWADVKAFLSRRGRPKSSLGHFNSAQKEKFVKLEKSKKELKETQAQTEENLEQKSTVKFDKKLSKNFSGGLSKSLSRSNFQPANDPKSNVTVPEPFEFDIRDKVKEKSIREAKFEEYLKQLKLEEEKHLNYRYRAKPVPSDVVVPKYESIMAAQETKRLEVKRNSIELTKSREKPFSFYERDKNKTKPEPELFVQTPFKANPIPWKSTVPLYQKMVTEEKAQREERISKAAQEKLRKASLPPRMEMHQKVKEQQQSTMQESSSRSFVAKPPPDFKKLQHSFQKTLEAKKNAKKPTKPLPFSFSKTDSISEEQKTQYKKEKMKSTHPETLDEEDKAKANWGVTYSKSSSNGITKKPKVEPAITKKVRAMVELKRKKLEEEEQKAHKLQLEEEKRKAKTENLKARVQNSEVIRQKLKDEQEKNKERNEEAKKKLQNNTKEYKNRLKEMQEKVNSRPLLVETVSDSAIKNQAKMKTLLKVKRSLQESKIPIDNYFNEEEKDLIEEAEYLVKIGRLII